MLSKDAIPLRLAGPGSKARAGQKPRYQFVAFTAGNVSTTTFFSAPSTLSTRRM